MATVEREFQYEHGWPADTDVPQAKADTVQKAAEHCAEMGAPMQTDPPPQVTAYATPAHEAAGEYIVRVDGVRLHST